MVFIKKTACLLVLAAILLSPLAASGSGSPDPGDDLVFTYDFFGMTLDVQFIEGAAILFFPDGPLELPQAVSGSGARYTDGETTFWIKGDDARLEMTGSVMD